MNTAETFLTTTGAARLAGVSSETIRAWARKGRLAAERTAGGVRLFREDDVRRAATAAEERRHASEAA